MVIDPLRGFGEPVVRAVRVEVLAGQFRAGEQPEVIAADYALPVDDVLAALRYEMTCERRALDAVAAAAAAAA